MKRFLLLCHLLFVLCHSGTCQVPVTVNRSTINTGGSIGLPGGAGGGILNAGISGTLYYQYGTLSSSSPYITSVTGSIQVNPTSGPVGTPISVAFWPTVILSTNTPPVSTNDVSASVVFKRSPGEPYSAGSGASQIYVITVVEEGNGGDTGPVVAYTTLTGQADSLAGISRKDTSSSLRKLVGFTLTPNTNAVLSSLAFHLTNTTTNGNDFSELALYQDADGRQELDAQDTLVASTTNANGYAIFTGLTNAIPSAARTFFLAGAFQPACQTQGSFISASLSPQNIVISLTETNRVIQVAGGSVLGKQYAFLDTTTAEDAAAAFALSNQIDSAVTGATNALHVAWSQNMATTTNALNQTWGGRLDSATRDLDASWSQQLATATNGWPNTQIISSKPDLMDTILPAAISGAVAIGAAFTSDSLGKQPVSPEFSPSK
jgi:hypothetical protein